MSYSIHMARKFAAWIVNRRVAEGVSSLENRALEESITLSFVNLAEFSRLQVPLFLQSFIFYCAVFDPLFFPATYQYFNKILDGQAKNAYDVLLENLIRCGHTRTLTTILDAPIRVLETPQDYRLSFTTFLSTTAAISDKFFTQLTLSRHTTLSISLYEPCAYGYMCMSIPATSQQPCQKMKLTSALTHIIPHLYSCDLPVRSQRKQQ